MILPSCTELVAHKNKHGDILDIQNDVKLRMWTYSIVRKLSINSASLKGEGLQLQYQISPGLGIY